MRFENWKIVFAEQRCQGTLRTWARELGIKEAWAEAIYDDVPPPLIREWTNPRYNYSLVKGSPLHRRLGFLATFLGNTPLRRNVCIVCITPLSPRAENAA